MAHTDMVELSLTDWVKTGSLCCCQVMIYPRSLGNSILSTCPKELMYHLHVVWDKTDCKSGAKRRC